MSDLRVFTLVLVAKPEDGDPIIGLRAILKLALRRYGLRCTMARELPDKDGQSPNSAPSVESVENSI
jgi:hypothetical protein